MRILVQRIKEGKVTVAGEEISRAGAGLCLFIGIAKGDTQEDACTLAEKAVGLRIFEDDAGKFNRSLREVDGEILLVSEFTLYADCSKGRRPSFIQAAPPEEAESLYRHFIQKLQELGLKVATGTFQAKMEVSITNDGPVTLILDSK
ncbi:MAG: D-tyrosyl-tRNA(Tyr) deacylase [Deltaproteobacteria bacterium]|nr:D-tyrosyl-tRNA(Tyr) deacylase [Deltaproteobacteria bacterium]